MRLLISDNKSARQKTDIPYLNMDKNKKKIARTFVLIGSVMIGILLIISGCTNNAQEKKSNDPFCKDCNVIFINIELLRADYVDLISTEHGNNTPNIDRFFKNGIIFEDVTASAGETGISNIATLTNTDSYFVNQIVSIFYKSLNQLEQGNKTGDHSLVSKFTKYLTIAQILQANGYRTICINDGAFSGKYTFMDAGCEKYYDVTNDPSYNAGITTTVKNIMLLENLKGKEQNKFFLLYHSDALHALPYKYPLAREHDTNPLIEYIHPENSDYYETRFHIAKNGTILNKGELRAELFNTDWMDNTTFNTYHQLAHTVYAQQVRYVDTELGKIFSELEQSGMLKNSIVVLYANHGDGLYDNNIPNHGVTYQSCVHVPLLIRLPSSTRQERITTPVALIDLAPTIYQMTRVEKRNISDLSPDAATARAGLLPAILNGTYDREYIFGMNNGEFVRYQDMKLHLLTDNQKELYNITSDPHEEHNIAAQYPEIVKALNDIISAHDIQVQKEFNDRFENRTIGR